MAQIQRTLILVKPDALQRDLVGEIVHRFERKGLKIIGMKMIQLGDAMLGLALRPHCRQAVLRRRQTVHDVLASYCHGARRGRSHQCRASNPRADQSLRS